jgi:hypothetical protein
MPSELLVGQNGSEATDIVYDTLAYAMISASRIRRLFEMEVPIHRQIDGLIHQRSLSPDLE